MSARVLTINERHLRTPGNLASLADFTCTEGEEVNPKVVVEDLDMSLYCLDDETRRAIFVKLPPGVDLTKAPFVYLTQGERAEYLVAIPYDAFKQLAVGLPETENLVSIYGTGRSGSTLISHAFNASGAVVSLSEPDVATQFTLLREPDGSRDAELSGLIDSAVRFLFRPNPYNQATTCALKFRGLAVRAMDLYGLALPRARSLLLYREAVGWVTSMYRLFKESGASEREPLTERIGFFEQLYKKDADDLKVYLGEGDEDVPLVKSLALWWLFLMEDCLTQYERGVRALAVRYDDLNTHREAVLNQIFAYCDLPVSGVERALAAFDRDAQVGTGLARADPKQGNALRLTDLQLADIYDVLERHPVINTPDFRLPETLEV